MNVKVIAKTMLYRGLPVPACCRPLVRAAYRFGVGMVEAIAVLKRVLWIEPVMRSVCARMGRGFRAEQLPYMRGKGRIILGDRIYLSGRSCFYFMRIPGGGSGSEPVITVGSDTFIGNGCTLSCANAVTLGARCLIASGVRIHDNDGHPLDTDRRSRGEAITLEETAPVVIGDNVWIGANAVILKGVEIGDNSVVATGAIVTRDVPANSVVAGNPARIVDHD